MIKVSKLNEKLIKEVLAHIKKFPQAYNQNHVAYECEITKQTPCGTIGCFGGWAVLLRMPAKKRQLEAETVNLDEAQVFLGLTDDEANYLFETASGNPREDLLLIKRRLDNIRQARELLAQNKRLFHVVLEFEENNQSVQLGYGKED